MHDASLEGKLAKGVLLRERREQKQSFFLSVASDEELLDGISVSMKPEALEANRLDRLTRTLVASWDDVACEEGLNLVRLLW